MATVPLSAIDFELYKARVGPAFTNLNANYLEAAKNASGLIARLEAFFGPADPDISAHAAVVKRFGGKTIQQVLIEQANYWQGRGDADPKYGAAVGFRRQWGNFPNGFEVDTGSSMLIGGTATVPPPPPSPLGFLDTAIAWVTANPLLAGAGAVGAYILLKGKRRF